MTVKPEKHETVYSIAIFIALIALFAGFCYVSYYKGRFDEQEEQRAIIDEIERDQDKAWSILFEATKARANSEEELRLCHEVGKNIVKDGQKIGTCLDCHVRH
jgi:hypothetical protein